MITSVEPQYGVNFGPGFSGFTYYDDSFVSKGIAWFSRQSLMSMPRRPVSHALTVSGPDECIEAHMGDGVVRSSLSKYFASPHCHIFFRKPVFYDDAMAQLIVSTVATHIGDGYDTGLIPANALAGSLLGKIINRWSNNLPNRVVSWLLSSKKKEVCSELNAIGLQAVPVLRNRGCLKLPARMVTPQMLAFDAHVFAPFKAV